MKFFTTTLFVMTCSMLVSNLVFATDKDKDLDIYAAFNADVVLAKDDLNTWVGEVGTRLTLGVQHTKSFAFEIFGELQTAKEPKLLYDDVDENFLGYRSIKSKGTQYFGGLGVFTIKPSFMRPVSLIAKVGIARYDTRRLSGRGSFYTEDNHSVLIQEREFDWSISGFSPIIGLGLEHPRTWKNFSSQLVVTHVLHEDVRSLSASCGIKYSF